jgi:prevent-host-death family protein
MKKCTTPYEEFTVEQFQERWDELMDRVYEGESFVITSDSTKVVITPATDELTSLTERHN